MAQPDSVVRINELIQGFNLAILTTVRPNGSLHSCPMATRGLDADGAFWFLAKDSSEKVEAVRTMQRVALCFADAAANRYVSISGFCELVRDRAKAKALWDAKYQTWLPGGAEDPSLVLMKIVVQQAEYWDSSQSRTLSLTGFDPTAMT